MFSSLVAFAHHPIGHVDELIPIFLRYARILKSTNGAQTGATENE